MDNEDIVRKFDGIESKMDEFVGHMGEMKTGLALLTEALNRDRIDNQDIRTWVRNNMGGGISAKVDHLERTILQQSEALKAHATATLEANKLQAQSTAENAEAIAKLQQWVTFGAGGVFVLGIIWQLVGDIVKQAIHQKFYGG